MKRALVPASILLLLAGCQQPGPSVARPFAPEEEGLTLVYLNPSLPSDQQQAQRLQVRVEKVVEGPKGGQVITKSFASGVQPPFRTDTLLKDGGVALLSPDGKSQISLLPEGFPSLEGWSTPAGTYRVLGRGEWVARGSVLPADRPAEGVWVESRSLSGSVTRSLYLPGLGEVQTDLRQSDGHWQTVNLLTQYGFTDAPITPKEDKPEPTPKKRKRSKATA
ncbi:MAG: membrane lipoprotein lipid attachment site-containing protein [Acidobacteria bacterium]|nr:membrane lipoprotein lipid attachment site-containing protein [Acidobacteriota bacterium]